VSETASETASETTWATVRLVLRTSASEAALHEAIDRLESVAMMLADRPEVGGVETRDPFIITEGPDFRAVEVPELIAYTTPEARAVVEVAALALAHEFNLEVEVDSADHQGDDWRDAWKRYYRPLRFVSDDGTRALLIRPSWIARTGDDPQAELVLDPGRAFGTGLHESTRLCVQALVELAAHAAIEPRSLIDLGCGSGILGLAALRLFPTLEQALLVDHDCEATETARENAELNALVDRIETREVMLGEGDTTRMLAGPHALVLANIRPSVLIPCASAIVELLAPGGALVLSGILIEEGEAVRAAYPSLTEIERRIENDWVALVLRRELS
jgi:ribosomal protein L11 methyltransferase